MITVILPALPASLWIPVVVIFAWLSLFVLTLWLGTRKPKIQAEVLYWCTICGQVRKASVMATLTDSTRQGICMGCFTEESRSLKQ